MADPQDKKGAHAREFTNIEDLCLEVWFNLKVAKKDALAQTLLDAGLMFEHYTSLLDSDFDKRPPSEIVAQAQLAVAFQFQLQEAVDALKSIAEAQVDKLRVLVKPRPAEEF